MFNLISWIVFGLIVGVIARFLLPGRDPAGMIATMFIGIAGALVGGWLSTIIGFGLQGQSAGWIMSIVGAILLLLAFRAFRGSPSSY